MYLANGIPLPSERVNSDGEPFFADSMNLLENQFLIDELDEDQASEDFAYKSRDQNRSDLQNYTEEDPDEEYAVSDVSVQDPFGKFDTKGGKILKKKISELCESYGVKFDYPAGKSESGISDTSSEGEDPALKKRVDSDDDSQVEDEEVQTLQQQ